MASLHVLIPPHFPLGTEGVEKEILGEDRGAAVGREKNEKCLQTIGGWFQRAEIRFWQIFIIHFQLLFL